MASTSANPIDPVKLDKLAEVAIKVGLQLEKGQDLVLTAIFSGLILLLVFAFYKEFLVMSFDPVLAATLRLPVRLLDYLLMVLIAIAIVVSLQTVGVALMVAMLVTPAAAAYLLTRRLPVMMVLAAAIAAFSGVVGLYLSYYLNVASGSASVLTCTAVFAMVWAGTTIKGRRFEKNKA